MKHLIITILACGLLGACATEPSDGVRRSQIRDCPVGMVLICESRRDQDPSSAGDEEIPEYDFCRCEQIM